MVKGKSETVKATDNVKGLDLSIIEVDGVESIRIVGLLSTEPVLSASGKSRTLASTGGFVYLSDGTGVSLNVIESVKRPRAS